MYVRICVSVYLCMYVCMYVYMLACLYSMCSKNRKYRNEQNCTTFQSVYNEHMYECVCICMLYVVVGTLYLVPSTYYLVPCT